MGLHELPMRFFFLEPPYTRKVKVFHWTGNNAPRPSSQRTVFAPAQQPRQRGRGQASLCTSERTRPCSPQQDRVLWRHVITKVPRNSHHVREWSRAVQTPKSLAARLLQRHNEDAPTKLSKGRTRQVARLPHNIQTGPRSWPIGQRRSGGKGRRGNRAKYCKPIPAGDTLPPKVVRIN